MMQSDRDICCVKFIILRDSGINDMTSTADE